MRKDILTRFFADRPAINKAAFARECCVTMTMLGYWLCGSRPISDKAWATLCRVAARYGGNFLG
jgi:hypothetical protein